VVEAWIIDEFLDNPVGHRYAIAQVQLRQFYFVVRDTAGSRQDVFLVLDNGER
jgi:hypothetical protein